MEPRVLKRERKVHLSYDLPNRIRCASIYPEQAPNGSTVILYGHDRGLRLLWRGGRRLQQNANANKTSANGFSQNSDIIMIDDDEEQTPAQADSDENVEYEAEEDEVDPDCPYPNIVHSLNIDLGGPVLNLAVPSLPTFTSSAESPFREQVVVALSTAKNQIKLLRIPLAPRPVDQSDKLVKKILEKAVRLQAGRDYVRDVAVKYIAEPDPRIVLAAVSDELDIWQLLVSDDDVYNDEDNYTRVEVPHLTKKLAFQPTSHSLQLLLVDDSGAARIYEPFAHPIPGSSSFDDSRDSGDGKWLAVYHAPFNTQKEDEPSIASRKKVLDAKWILNGRCILTVLDDGEWGIWDLSGSTQTGKSFQDFALSGFLGSATSDSSEQTNQKRTASKFAPMTPNTRKAKASNLFSTQAKPTSSIAARGGISVSSVSNLNGSVDESVMIWFNSDIYSIPNVQSFWQRSTSGAGGLGTLYAPGIAQVRDINLFNENITSVAQFASKATASGVGRLNTQRDFLLSAESRIIIVHSLPQASATSLFQKAQETADKKDQRMLVAGELDVGGMDRILDNMAGGDDRSRRVGFAH